MREELLRRLVKLSYKNNHIGTHHGKFRHFSYLIYKNRIISTGYNKPTTHPLASEYGSFYAGIHSELNAIIKLPYNTTQYKKLISKCDMVNIRLTQIGNICISKPCDVCEQLLREYNINNVYYTITKGNIKKYNISDVFRTYCV